jgi:cytochrome bd-type quinol oxidase subunit 2
MIYEGPAKSGGRVPQEQYCATLVNISSELSHSVCLSSSTLSTSAVFLYAILSSGRETFPAFSSTSEAPIGYHVWSTHFFGASHLPAILLVVIFGALFYARSCQGSNSTTNLCE